MPQSVTLTWEEYKELRDAYEEKQSSLFDAITIAKGMRFIKFPDDSLHLALSGYMDPARGWTCFSASDGVPFRAIELRDGRGQLVSIYTKTDSE